MTMEAQLQSAEFLKQRLRELQHDSDGQGGPDPAGVLR